MKTEVIAYGIQNTRSLTETPLPEADMRGTKQEEEDYFYTIHLVPEPTFGCTLVIHTTVSGYLRSNQGVTKLNHG